MNTTVPVGSLAHVFFPLSGLRSVEESGVPLWQANEGLLHRVDFIREISFERTPYPAIKITVASGMYSMRGAYED